jgi:hypothetical protein
MPPVLSEVPFIGPVLAQFEMPASFSPAMPPVLLEKPFIGPLLVQLRALNNS